MKIKIGCDPELFCFDTTTNEPVSVHDLLPGDKCNPHTVPLGAIQVDGTAAEFNINPAESSSIFIRNIKHVQNILNLAIQSKNPKFILRAEPSVLFNKDYFDNLPPFCKELGCTPDYNAYDGKTNPKPDANTLMRTGSGHVHVGWTNGVSWSDSSHFETCRKLVKELDAVLYDFSYLWDSDTRRQLLYGKPGAFRPKPYGLEYRVLSNAWLRDESVMQYVFDATKLATEMFFRGESIKNILRDADNSVTVLENAGIKIPDVFVMKEIKVA